MRIEKIVCDRCGAEINKRYPEKVQVLQSVVKENKYNKNMIERSYKAHLKFHLCENCRREFYEFMKVSGETNG